MSKRNWKFKKGDNVKVIGNSHLHDYEEGSVMEVRNRDKEFGSINVYRMKVDNSMGVAECDLELITKNK
jgi:hypothetical protein